MWAAVGSELFDVDVLPLVEVVAAALPEVAVVVVAPVGFGAGAVKPGVVPACGTFSLWTRT